MSVDLIQPPRYSSPMGWARAFLAAFLVAWLLPSIATAQDVRHVKCLYQIVCGNFDVILVAGQSNATSRGLSKRLRGALTSPHVYQLGRYAWDYEIIPAREPLNNVMTDGAEQLVHGLGFGIPFALAYERARTADRDILLIPAAKGGSSVMGEDAYWRPDGPGNQDVTERLDSALHEYRHSRLRAILWHHGEADLASDFDEYHDAVVRLLVDIRARYDPESRIPIILGELTPSLVAISPRAALMNETIHRIAASIPNAAVARSDTLASNGDMSEERFDRVHFSGEAQIEFGKRYFCAYARLTQPSGEVARNPYCRKWTIVVGQQQTSWRDWLIDWAIAAD